MCDIVTCDMLCHNVALSPLLDQRLTLLLYRNHVLLRTALRAKTGTYTYGLPGITGTPQSRVSVVVHYVRGL